MEHTITMNRKRERGNDTERPVLKVRDCKHKMCAEQFKRFAAPDPTLPLMTSIDGHRELVQALTKASLEYYATVILPGEIPILTETVPTDPLAQDSDLMSILSDTK